MDYVSGVACEVKKLSNVRKIYEKAFDFISIGHWGLGVNESEIVNILKETT